MTEAASPLSGLRVLVVEDEMLLALDLEAQLADAGCTVVGPASRQSQALALAASEVIDAAILDLNLAGERPVELANNLVERGVPFIIVSGYSALGLQEPAFSRARRLGKPVDTEALMRTLSEIAPSDRPTRPRDLQSDGKTKASSA